MTDKFLTVAVQYVRHASAQAHVRPYQNRHPLQNDVGLWLDVEALPEEGHWRVEVEAHVSAVNSEGVLCFETSAAVEAIVVVGGLTEEEVQSALRHNVASALVGNVRVALSNASAGTGYGPLVLPPMEAERVAALPPKPVIPLLTDSE